MYKCFLKRLFDIVFSVFLLPFFLVLWVIIAPIIFFTDKGPVFYNAKRLGKNGKEFKMYKFRSMIVNAPDYRNEDGSTRISSNDDRITIIGKFIRKTSLDELPQILNVLKGDMSFIGPRPVLGDIPYTNYDEVYKKRFEVRPGITGYSQAYFRNSITQHDQFVNDVIYCKKISFWFDIKIFFKTIFVVLSKKNIYKK